MPGRSWECGSRTAGRGLDIRRLVCDCRMYYGMASMSDISPLYFLLHPVGTALFAFAMLRSAV